MQFLFKTSMDELENILYPGSPHKFSKKTLILVEKYMYKIKTKIRLVHIKVSGKTIYMYMFTNCMVFVLCLIIISHSQTIHFNIDKLRTKNIFPS